MNWIFGYGSLINKGSRNKTGQSGQAIPVNVKGIKRQWNLVVNNSTAVGAIYFPEGICNGVIYHVEENEIPKFDKREIPFGYSRIKLNKRTITPLLGFKVPDGTVWAYVANNPGKPSLESPIIQSYVDVILTGCLEYSEQFARDFVKNTEFWDYPWINDRKNPRYPRAIDNPDVEKIDFILKDEIAKEFSKRQNV